MSNRKTRDHTQSGRSRAYEPLTPESAVLLLVDHQSGLVSGVRDLAPDEVRHNIVAFARAARVLRVPVVLTSTAPMMRSEEHTSELQSPCNLVCRLLLEKKKKKSKHDILSMLLYK